VGVYDGCGDYVKYASGVEEDCGEQMELYWVEEGEYMI